ncbi:hypothetical protein FS837_002516 [Tulasnella sp. UAMH 9824]|nr:hypothetical protein FS837_002516 [Tulasnella sp. UAMH 9824]
MSLAISARSDVAPNHSPPRDDVNTLFARTRSSLAFATSSPRTHSANLTVRAFGSPLSSFRTQEYLYTGVHNPVLRIKPSIRHSEFYSPSLGSPQYRLDELILVPSLVGRRKSGGRLMVARRSSRRHSTGGSERQAANSGVETLSWNRGRCQFGHVDDAMRSRTDGVVEGARRKDDGKPLANSIGETMVDSKEAAQLE